MSNVIDLGTARRKKALEEAHSQGRTPLAVSYATGKISDGLNDRLQRVRDSLDKINRLMAELRMLSTSNGSEKEQEMKEPE